MEIKIKLNEKLIKQMFELKFNNGRKIQTETFDSLIHIIEWKYRDKIKEVIGGLEPFIITQILDSTNSLNYHLKCREKINRHNKRHKLNGNKYQSGYRSFNSRNCCPKCNEYTNNDDSTYVVEPFLQYSKDKYKIDFGEEYKDILESNGFCRSCGLNYIEVYTNELETYHFHEIK